MEVALRHGKQQVHPTLRSILRLIQRDKIRATYNAKTNCQMKYTGGHSRSASALLPTLAETLLTVTPTNKS
jgi:HD-GYP domain-containing protein (c-di-GMP phosphodiesterase class II)